MDMSLFGFSGLRELFNLHPMFVHVPLALIPAAWLFYALGVALKNRSLLVAGRSSLYLALLGTIPTVWTGLNAMESFPHNATIHHMAQTHKVVAFWIVGGLAVLTLWSFWADDQKPRGVWGFLALLAGALFLTMQNGDIGARMVYVQGAAVKPAIAVIAPPDEIKEFEENHHSK